MADCGARAPYSPLAIRHSLFAIRDGPSGETFDVAMPHCVSAAFPGHSRQRSTPIKRPTGKRMASAGTASAPAIVASGASKLFLDGAVVAFHQLSLEVRRNEILCVVGPSGCGKTTLLRCIAGLTDLSDGEILVQGKPVQGVPPDGLPMAL